MTNILRDKQSKFVMMWLVCMISLALCLHFNEHVTENEFQRHVSRRQDREVYAFQ